MATPTPRKFQEKIAQLNERAAQGTAAFKDIMQEVSSLRNQQNRSHTYYPYGPLQGAMNDLHCLRQRYQMEETDLPSAMQQDHHENNSLRHNAIPHPSTHRSIHLTPPELLSRSSSDSSLHQSALQAKIVANITGSSVRKGSAPEERSRYCQTGYNYDPHGTLTHPGISGEKQIYRPNSNMPIPTDCAPSNLGGPSAGPGGGSLPDLTQVQFMQPVGMPLIDGEGSMDYKSISGHGPQTDCGIVRGSFARGTNGPYFRSPTRGISPGVSPRLSPVFDRKQKTKPYSHTPTLTNQRLSMANKAIVTDNSPRIAPIDTHLANSGINLLGGPISPGGSHPNSPLPYMDYRNPTSPCASPAPTYMPAMTSLSNYRNNSSDTRSAPPSPICLQQTSSPSSSPGVALVKAFPYDYAQPAVPAPATQQLNHQFQQITVMDSQNGGMTYNPAMMTQSQIDQQVETCQGTTYYNSSASTSPVGATPQSNYPISPTGSPSSTVIESNQVSQPHMYHVCSSPTQVSSPSHSPISPVGSINSAPLHHPTTPQTPQTPNVNVPRVVLTDQDGNDDRELLMNDMTELPAFLFEEFMLKNLSSLGEEELMSVDQIMVDTEIEESFRRDLRNSIAQEQQYETNALSGQTSPINIIPSQTQASPIQHSPQTDGTGQSSPQSQMSDQSSHNLVNQQSPHCLTNLEPVRRDRLLENEVICLNQGTLSQIDLDLHSTDFDPINCVPGHCNSNVSSWLSQANPHS